MARKNIGNRSLFDSALSNHKVMHEFDDIYKLVDWDKIEALLACVHSSSCGGASYPPLIMFRAMLLQVWHKLSDPEAEKQLYRDLLFRRFCGLSLMDNVPDHSTISRFRNHLIAKDLYRKLLDEINHQLAEKGAIVKVGEVSIVDATVIEAHQCRKKPGVNKENTQDPQAGWSVKTGTKGRQEFTYGFKAHVNVDEDGFVKSLETTAGNIHDSQKLEDVLTGTEEELYADSAYAGEPVANVLTAKGIKNRINRRAYRNNPLTDKDKDYNRTMSSVRYVIERTFGTFKRHYGANKTRFLGIQKTHAWITTISMVHNLKKAAVLLRPGPLEERYA
jgi:transposase, IS5 family